MQIRRVLCLAVVSLMTVGVAWTDNDCRFSEAREAMIEVDGLTELRIDAGAGYLHVEGRDDLEQIRIVGTACSSKKSTLDDIRLETRRSQSRVVVETEFPEWGWSGGEARLDMTVEVPARMLVIINDGSGELRISNVAAVEVEDGSGEMLITEIAGDVEVSDGSGEIEIRRVRGSVHLEDGSGEIDVAHVDGDVVVHDDGSGDIVISDVGGEVRIDDDGSGDITVDGVGRDFTVDDDGSGHIKYNDVEGRVDIPRKHR